MAKNEFFFLVIVLAAFGGFGLAMGIATFRYKSWLNRKH